MKTLTTLIAVVATSFAINANAEYIDTETLSIGEIFPIQEVSYSSAEVVSVSLPNEMVWGGENKGWILNTTQENAVASALLELESNPPAAGRSNTREIFIWNDNAGDYQLQ